MKDFDEDEDQEELVVLGDAGCAVMRVGAGLWVAAASAAATARRMEVMSSGRRLGVGGCGGPDVTWRPGGMMWSAAVGEGGAGLRSSPCGLGLAGVLQCVRLCGLALAGGNSPWAASGGMRGGGPGVPGVCAGGVCGSLGELVVPWGLGLLAVGVCGLLGVGGGEGCSAGGSVAGVCGFFGGWGRPVSRGPGLPAMVGVCGPPGVKRRGRRRGGDCARGVCCVGVCVRLQRAPVWSVVGRAVWRRGLPSSAAAARTLQMSVHIWCTSWSVMGRGYPSSGLRPTRQRILWMAWYPQLRECCGLGGGFFRVSGHASICVWAVGMAQIQGTVSMDGQRRLIHPVRQSMASLRW